MKKSIVCLLLLLCLVPLMGTAEEAEDITSLCTFTFAPRSEGKKNMTDASYLTAYTGKYLEITAPEGTGCHGLYVSFSGREAPFQVQVMNAESQWEEVLSDERLYANTYLPLPGLSHFRITPVNGENISIAEIHLLSAGEKPAWVQDWQPFEGKADLMVLSAHGDDELLFFGGVIPYYAGEMQKKVIVCYLTDQTSCRRNELLDGLWLCGVRAYPSMGVFKDIKNDSLGDSYGFWGEKPVVEYLEGLLRRYRPDVVVTHDKNGEYGHGAHRVCADAMMKALPLAAGGEEGWQVKKMYLHLYRENQLVFDWRQPLDFFGGRTAFDVAEAAFECHASQQSNGLIVQDWGPYANNVFGLYHTTVGPDEAGNDFFEHIE